MFSSGETQMDEKLARKINRQLRAIKVMLGFFTILMCVVLVVLGYMAWKVLTFTSSVEKKINVIQQSTQQKLDIKSQLCDDANSNTITDQFCN